MSEQLRHKMINTEVEPPPIAWKAIAARMEDDDRYASLSSKMNVLESRPPPLLWEAIANRLEETSPAPASQNPKASYRIFYRLSAVAVMIVLVAGAMFFLSKNARKTPGSKDSALALFQQATKSSNKTRSNTIPADHIPGKRKENNARPTNNQPAWSAAKTYTPITAGSDVQQTIKYAMVDLPNSRKSAAAVNAPPILDKNGNPIMDIDVLTTNSNYLVVAGPNGQLTRISSKFSTVIRYLNGSNNNSTDTEEYIDRVIKESDTWKKRYLEWRNKITRSVYIPSSVNFLDIAEFKDLIQEK
ncbi:MAG: hypothetical protein ABI813_06010 [Bacteroidota bacterium]